MRLTRRFHAPAAAVLSLTLTSAAVPFAWSAAPTRGPATSAPVWMVDKAASRLSFRGTFSGEAFNGVFKRWDAQIAFDPKALAASRVSVTVDLSSAVTGDPTRDQALPTDDWFSTKKFPRATFVSNTVRAAGPGRYQAVGELSIRGVKRPLTLPFALAIAGDTAKMDAAVALDRTAFGIGQGQFKGGETVAASVAVGVKLTAKRK